MPPHPEVLCPVKALNLTIDTFGVWQCSREATMGRQPEILNLAAPER